jgi:hypothetical protein
MRILIIILIALIPICLQAQKQIITESVGIETEKIFIRKTNSNQLVNYKDFKSDIIQKLGNPNSIKSYYYEMMEVEGELLLYGDNRIYLINNRFDAFTLYDQDISVSYEGESIKVGDPISEVSKIFPHYLSDKYKGNDFIRIPYRYGDAPVDVFLTINFSPNTNIITRIYKHNP